PWPTDAGRIERTKIKLGVVVAGLRGLRIAIGHLLVGNRIGGTNRRVRNESNAAKDCQKGSLHQILQDVGKVTPPVLYCWSHALFCSRVQKVLHVSAVTVQETRKASVVRGEDRASLGRA